jgi:transposase
MVQRYPTDLTDREWTVLLPLVPAAKAGGWPPAYHRHARGGECQLVYPAERVSMAYASERLSAPPNGLPLLSDLAPRRRVGAHARYAARGSVRGLWPHP